MLCTKDQTKYQPSVKQVTVQCILNDKLHSTYTVHVKDATNKFAKIWHMYIVSFKGQNFTMI